MKVIALIFLIPILSLSSTVRAQPVYQLPGAIADLDDPFIAAGFNALFTCSAHFVMGRPLSDVLKVELADTTPLQLQTPEIDRHRHVVRVNWRDNEPPRVAAWREGMGCTIIPPHWNEGDISRLPFIQYEENPDVSKLAWPMGDRLTIEEPAELNDALTGAFDSATFGEGSLTTGVVVLRDGVIIAERYRDGFGPHRGYRTWSTAKSITGALIGIAVNEGLLEIEAPAPINEWQSPGDPRQQILLQELLWMSSGLVSGGANTNAMYFGGQDVVSAATTTPLEHEPGTRWKYANNDTLLTLLALRQTLDDDTRYLRYPYEKLLHRIGMFNTVMETDHLGNYIGSSQVYTTARDLARFGLLLVNEGGWMGEQILPEGWTEFLRQGAPAFKNKPGKRGYGAQFWLFGGMNDLPLDTYSSAGNKGQFVTVLPSDGIVVVRTGVDPTPSWNQPAFTAAVLTALKRR